MSCNFLNAKEPDQTAIYNNIGRQNMCGIEPCDFIIETEGYLEQTF